MKTEIIRFSIVKTSLIISVILEIMLALVMIPFALLSSFMGYLMGDMGMMGSMTAIGPVALLVMLVFMFVMNFFGIAGLLWTYNLVAKLWGGIEWEAREKS